MRFLVLCLCATSALGAAVDTQSVKMSEGLKTIEMPIKMVETFVNKDDSLLKKNVEVPVKMVESHINADDVLLRKTVEMPIKMIESRINMDDSLLKKTVEMPIKMDDSLVKRDIEVPVKMVDSHLNMADSLLKKNIEVPVKMVESHINMDDSLLKKTETLIKPLLETDNKFIETIGNVNLENPWKNVAGEHLLFNNLLKHTDFIKPEIQSAFKLKDELDHYKKMNYPDLMPFTNDDGEVVYGIMTENAPVPTISLQGIDAKKDVKFHFFNKFDEKDLLGVEVTDISKLKELGWDENKPVKMIIHGFINSIKSPVIQMIKNAYLKTGQYNVIGVDWGKLAANNVLWYPWARNNVPAVGARVGNFLDELVSAKATEGRNVHIIGHSLGAHVAGIAAKSMKMAKPARITGLDPAKPFFELTDRAGRLIKDDAELVDIIHTNAGYLGRTDLLGHVDFFPNGGTWQVGCNIDVWGACSHGRSYELFSKTILEGRGLDGVRCEGLPGLSTGRKCLARTAANEPIVMALMGDNVQFKESGPYFVDYDLVKLA